jgi:hypothetical protein
MEEGATVHGIQAVFRSWKRQKTRFFLGLSERMLANQYLHFRLMKISSEYYLSELQDNKFVLFET